MHGISLQPSNPIIEPTCDKGHDVHHSGGRIHFLLEMNNVIINRIRQLQLQLVIHVTFF